MDVSARCKYAVGLMVLLTSSVHLWSSEDSPPALLPKQSFEVLLKHTKEAADPLEKIAAELQPTAADERVLLHLPKRGFPWLASFLHQGDPFDEPKSVYIYGRAGSTVFMPELELPTFSREEDAAGDILIMALKNRAAANLYTCFRLLKELAPSPEAMRVEKQAKELADKLRWREYTAYWLPRTGYPAEANFLEILESVRTLFDQLKDLPRMSPEAFARERAESAMMARSEYEEDERKLNPADNRTWSEQRLDRQSHWDHEGFLVVYSESLGPEDDSHYQMFVKPLGGIFEASHQPGVSTVYTGPYSYESKLRPADLHALEDCLKKMPPSNANGEGIHFIISFSENGNWVTRTYSSLPEENPFQVILHKMIHQSVYGKHEDPSENPEFLEPE